MPRSAAMPGKAARPAKPASGGKAARPVRPSKVAEAATPARAEPVPKNGKKSRSGPSGRHKIGSRKNRKDGRLSLAEARVLMGRLHEAQAQIGSLKRELAEAKAHLAKAHTKAEASTQCDTRPIAHVQTCSRGCGESREGSVPLCARTIFELP